MSEKLKIAKNINTPAEKLRSLSKIEDKEILAAIAKNPNSPPDLLIDLAGEYLDEIELNPALDLILLEYPNFISDIFYEHCSDIDNSVKKITFPSTKLPNWVSNFGLNHSDPQIRSFIARNEYTPVTYLEQLANDEDSEVRESITENDYAPIHILEKLADDEDDYIRYCLAQYKNIPEILEKLAKDRSVLIRLAVANNPNINPTIIKLLFEDRNYNLNYKQRVPKYKQIRAAIELEIKRLDWTAERAVKSLKEKYGLRDFYMEFQRGIVNNKKEEKLVLFLEYLNSIESDSYPPSLRKNVFMNSFEGIP